MDIRPVVAADLDDLAEVHRASWLAAFGGLLPPGVADGLTVEWFRRRWERLLGEAGPRAVAGRVGGRVRGFAVCGPCRDAGAGAAGEFYALYTHPDEWGRGLGTALCQAAGTLLRDDGHPEAVLWVLAANARARAFYERRGFLPRPDRIRSYRRFGLTLPEVQFHKPLEG